MQLCDDMGIDVEARHIAVDELKEVTEAGACGTAAVISPVREIDDLDTGDKYVVSADGEPGPISTMLYNKLRGIQLGEEEDVHGWNSVFEGI